MSIGVIGKLRILSTYYLLSKKKNIDFEDFTLKMVCLKS